MAGPLPADTPGLLAQWDFDGESGSGVRDSSGHGHDGLLYGRSKLVAEVELSAVKARELRRPALRLDGKSAISLRVEPFANLKAATVEAWVQWDHLEGLQSFFGYGAMNG